MKDSSSETEKTIISLKTQVKEQKRIEEVLRAQLKERKAAWSNLECEIVGLRKKLEEWMTKMKRQLEEREEHCEKLEEEITSLRKELEKTVT